MNKNDGQSVIRVKISRVNKKQPGDILEISYLLVEEEFETMKEAESWLQKYWKKRKETGKKTVWDRVESLFKFPKF